MIRAEHGRYLAGGAVCALLNNLILIGGDALGFGYAMLTLPAFLITGTVGYLFHCRLTFRRAIGPAAYLAFMGGLALGVPLALLLLALLCSLLGLPMWVAAPLQTGLMILFNYANARLTVVGFGDIVRLRS